MSHAIFLSEQPHSRATERMLHRARLRCDNRERQERQAREAAELLASKRLERLQIRAERENAWRDEQAAVQAARDEELRAQRAAREATKAERRAANREAWSKKRQSAVAVNVQITSRAHTRRLRRAAWAAHEQGSFA